MKDYKKNKEEDKAGYLFGTTPPQALDMEKAVLGAMMQDRDCVPTVINLLKPESFYDASHGKIFKVMVKLFNECKNIDLLVVTEALLKTDELENVGGAFFVSELAQNVASSVNVEQHARIVQEKQILREVGALGNKLYKQAHDPTSDCFMLLEYAESQIFGIHNVGDTKKTKTLKNISDSNIEKILKLKKRRDRGEFAIVGIPSGFKKLDTITSGWQSSDLIVIAARPSMGKTALSLKLARNAAFDHNKPIAFFSLEMSGSKLANRILSAESEISGDKLKNGDLTDNEAQHLIDISKTMSEKIHIDETPALTITALRAKCRLLKMQYDIQMVVVDYLQLMKTEIRGQNTESMISDISSSLKAIAKELDIPVVALAQLNRALEARGGDKRPMLSDLRSSGAIEQDADIVIFLHRPEYYGFDTDDDGNSTKGVAELIIAKHRDGALGTVKVGFRDTLATFSDDPKHIDGYITTDDTGTGAASW